jgi:hypothetical protein
MTGLAKRRGIEAIERRIMPEELTCFGHVSPPAPAPRVTPAV